MTHSVLPIAPEVEVIEKTFAALKSRVPQQRVLTAKERIARLDALYNEVWRRRDDLKKAMWNDFRKPPEEVDLTEIFVVKSEIKAVKRGLRMCGPSGCPMDWRISAVLLGCVLRPKEWR